MWMSRMFFGLALCLVWGGCADEAGSEQTSDPRLLDCPEGATELASERAASTTATEDQRLAAEVRWCDRDGLAEGPYLEVGDDGRPLATGAFADDRAEGLWVWYHADSTMRRKQVTFAEGLTHGPASAWFEDGSPHYERHYERGGACGPWRTWPEAHGEEGESEPTTPIEQDFGPCDDGLPWEPPVVRDAPTNIERAWTGSCSHEANLVIGAERGQDEDALWCELDGVREGPFARFWDAARTRPREDGRYEDGLRTGTWHTFASTGEVVSRATYRDGTKDGAETLWRVDGSRLEAGTWAADLKHGVWETFYPSGPKASETTWVEGRKTGRELELALDGTARRETFWVADLRHGIERLYWPATPGDDANEGAVRSETPYVNGLRDGLMTAWHPDGRKAEEVLFDDDLALSAKTWDLDGQPSSEIIYEAGLPHGPATLWLRDPVLGLRVKDQGLYIRGLREGPWVGVYETTGTTWREHTFYGGYNDGPFAIWWPDGSRQAEGELYWGQLELVYRVWWDNENPALECAYHQGLRHGPCTEWWENGQMKARGEYAESAKIGEWQYWDEAGNPIPAPEGDAP